jgi:hypothetical protein
VIFTANKKYTYYPDINGNLDLPESERLSVEIIRPTAEERGELVWYEGSGRGAKAETGAGETAVRIRYNTSRILRHNAGAIKNLVIEDPESPGKGKAVADGAGLAAASFIGMNALVDAVCAEACADIMTETQKKISGSGSGSCGADGTNGS